jgi:hypothetical protein
MHKFKDQNRGRLNAAVLMILLTQNTLKKLLTKFFTHRNKYKSSFYLNNSVIKHQTCHFSYNANFKGSD